MLLIALVNLLATKLLAAEDLLVIALYARVTPADQVEPTPDAVVESILRGDLRHARRKVLSNHPISTKPQDFPVPFSRAGTITSFTFGRAKPDSRREEDSRFGIFSSIHVNHFYCVWLGPRNECIVVQQQSRLEYPHELAARHRFWHRDRYGQGIRGKVAILD
jgi:hypothetical protein